MIGGKCMHPKHPFNLALFVVCLSLACAADGLAQRVYSYLDEHGVRVYTNVPPKNLQTTDLPSTQIPAQQVSKGKKKHDSSSLSSTSREEASRPLPGTSPAIPPSIINPDAIVKERLDAIIEKYAGQYRLDPQLVQSIISHESGFNPRAVSHKGAQGLMQLMPATASRLGVRDPFDPEENIRGGVEHLRFLLDTFNNDLPLSLAAYNAGENLVQRIRRIPDYPETRAYVRTVTSRYGRNEMAPQHTEEAPPSPSTFRYVDDQGILHLTNIAPTQRSEPELVGWAIPAQSPE
jgi:hypothetical protein